MGVTARFQIPGGLKASGPGTHPSVEAVTRATLFASRSRRATLELAIRTDFQDRTQPPNSNPALCMAQTCCARSRPPLRGGARGGPPPTRSAPPPSDWTAPPALRRPVSCGEQTVVAGAPCRRMAAAPRSPLLCSGGCGTVLCVQIS